MTNEIEATKRGMYDMLEAMRKAKKHPTMLRAFEEAMEEHLEALRKEESAKQARIGELYSEIQQWRDIAVVRLSTIEQNQDDLSKARQANTEIQERMHAVDRAYFEQSQRNGEQARQIEKLEELNRIAGEELIRAQSVARQYGEDCRSAEKLSDDLSEKLTNATTVIGQQEQLIAGQRSAIAGMHAELTHSRVIRKAFIGAQEAFAVMDSALHSSAPYNAQKALGDDLVDEELTS